MSVCVLILLILLALYCDRGRIYLQLGWYTRAFDLNPYDFSKISPNPPNTYYPNLRLTSAIRQCVSEHYGGAYVLFGPAHSGKATAIADVLQSMRAAGQVARTIVLNGEDYNIHYAIRKENLLASWIRNIYFSHVQDLPNLGDAHQSISNLFPQEHGGQKTVIFIRNFERVMRHGDSSSVQEMITSAARMSNRLRSFVIILSTSSPQDYASLLKWNRENIRSVMKVCFFWQYEEIKAAVDHLYEQRYFTRPISEDQLLQLYESRGSFRCIGLVRRHLDEHFRDPSVAAGSVEPFVPQPMQAVKTARTTKMGAPCHGWCHAWCMIAGFVFVLMVVIHVCFFMRLEPLY